MNEGKAGFGRACFLCGHKRAVAILLLLAVMLSLFFCGGESGYRFDGMLKVHFLDAGQSDCTFIEVGGEYTLMIDASDEDHADDVCDYVRSLGYKEIDALVLTHPHSDHIGGARQVVESFFVESIYMTEEEGDEPYYSALLDVIEKYSIATFGAESGTALSLGKLIGSFLMPSDKRFDDGNDMSAVLSLTYGDVKLLFMGDAGADAEAELLDSRADTSAHVVKAGHHGSNGSSTEEFIRSTGASYVVFSCGIDNDYGHPSPLSVDRWKKNGARCFRTDLDSTILFCTDGEGIVMGGIEDADFWSNANLTLPDSTFTDSAEQGKYILDTETHTIHVRDCYKGMRLSGQRTARTNAPLTRLLAEGYTKCRCFN